jgi:exopolysaccharide production protein ExoQ
MPSILALILCVFFVAVLLRTERKHNPAVSGALWLPTLWLLKLGSKPLGRWFGTVSYGSQQEEGSALDRWALFALITLAVIVINCRKVEISRILKDNFWLILLYLYLGASILWSDYPLVSFKRWIRIAGTIPMAILILSEPSPLNAIQSVFRRCAYVLIPFSLLLIKYFPNYGVEYVTWSGQKMWIGVAMQKNGLGLLCAWTITVIISAFVQKLRTETFRIETNVSADGIVFGIAVYLILGGGFSYSATALGICLVGIGVLLLLNTVKNHVKFVATAIVAFVSIILLSLTFSEPLAATVSSAFGRDATFTGRTDIWRAVNGIASQHPLFGTGYGGFWGLADGMIVSVFKVQEAHNGYLCTYLEGGMIGLALLAAFLIAYYIRMLRELNKAYDWAVFGISILTMLLLQNFTEDNFLKTTGFLWNVTVFLMIVLTPSRSDEKVLDQVVRDTLGRASAVRWQSLTSSRPVVNSRRQSRYKIR